MDKGIEYIERFHPTVFLFENVKALTYKKHRDYYDSVLERLRQIKDRETSSSAYIVKSRVLNAKDFGVAQSRPRVFMIGFLRNRRINKFRWPRKVAACQVDAILGPPDAQMAACPKIVQQGASKSQIRNLMAGIENIAERGGDPIHEPWFIGIHASEKRCSVTRGVCPCLTKRRAEDKGFYVSDRGRLLTTEEMLSLQGVPPGRLIKPANIRQRKFDGCIGNAVAVPVLAALILELCIAVGFL